MPLSWDLPGWQTVSCVQNVTEYLPQPGPDPATPSFIDVRDYRMAFSAALWTHPGDEPVLVIVSADDAALLALVRDAYLLRVGEVAQAGR